jgi:hypothetical protein
VAELVIGVLHPGEMGAAVASALRARGYDVLWASEGRGPATARRAAAAGLRDAGTVAAMAAECDLILSVCPPHAAAAVAEQIVGYTGVYVDANAVSPTTARAIGEVVTARRAVRPGERIRRRIVGHVVGERIVERLAGAAEIDATPHAAVVDLDPGVRLVHDHARGEPERERGHHERERAMTADAFAREREVEIDVARRRGRILRLGEASEIRDQLGDVVARREPARDADLRGHLVRRALHRIRKRRERQQLGPRRVAEVSAERCARRRELHDDTRTRRRLRLDEPVLRAVLPELEVHVERPDAGARTEDPRACRDGGDPNLLAGDEVDDHVGVELLFAGVGRRRGHHRERRGVRVADGKRVGCIYRVERAQALEGRGRGRERIVVRQHVGTARIAIGMKRRVARVTGRMVVGAVPATDGLGGIGRLHEAARRVDRGRDVTVERDRERDVLARVRRDRLVEHRRGSPALRDRRRRKRSHDDGHEQERELETPHRLPSA